MMLIDRDDVVRNDLSDHLAFQVRWEVGSPEAVEADYADILAEGPFMLAVNDEVAWAGQNSNEMYRVAEKRLDYTNFQRWAGLADIYSAEMGVSRQGFLLRFAAMRRRLRQRSTSPGWIRWGKIYHWSNGSDLAWSSLLDRGHPEIEVRERFGEREVRYAR